MIAIAAPNVKDGSQTHSSSEPRTRRPASPKRRGDSGPQQPARNNTTAKTETQGQRHNRMAENGGQRGALSGSALKEKKLAETLPEKTGPTSPI
jgi:hypothetical protein